MLYHTEFTRISVNGPEIARDHKTDPNLYHDAYSETHLINCMAK